MGLPVNRFLLYHGNDLEMLAGVLAAELARPMPGRDLLAPDTILIPQPAMRRWLQKTLAETHGIAANLRFLAPGEFVREALDANVAGAGDEAVGDAEVLRWRLWRVLSDPQAMAEPVFAPLAPMLQGGADPLPAWTLAGELASAFEKYQAWRRGWLRRWDLGGDADDWQAELWRRATRGLNHRGRRLDAYLAQFDGPQAQAPGGLPSRVFAFACQNVSPDVLRVIGSSARAGTLHFFFLSPVAAWWGDLVTARERLAADASAVFDDDEHALLRANGAAGRDFIRTLFSYEVVHPDQDFPLYVPPDPAERTGLLHQLQTDLLARRPAPAGSASRPAFGEAALADGSLQAHACHTRLREVQVLHDQLRRLLELDPTLQARDIAVLTPAIDDYAPLVHAVFGGNDGARQIPYALGDGNPLATQACAAAFMRLLCLPGSGLAAEEVLDLLSVAPVAQTLDLDAGDFSMLREMLRNAGVRWGLDEKHRLRQGAPAEHSFTWAWALDRLLLGHANGGDDDIAGVAPWPEIEGSAVARLDALMRGLDRLAHWQRVLAGDHPPTQWQDLLGQLLDTMFAEHPLDPADRRCLQSLRAMLATFGRQAATAGLQKPVPADVVRAWFTAALAEGDERQPFLTGGVTFGRMVPMRLVPFKVICLLGMDEGSFPRRDPPGSLNRLSAELGTPRRKPGDRSVRDDDRGLFLQLFAAASQVFYVSFLGLDPRSGESSPPSVVVSELLDLAADYFSNSAQARQQMIVAHPLQPFAPEAFGLGDARRISYQAGWSAAAGARNARQSMPVFSRPTPPARVQSIDSNVILRDDLVRTLAHPTREFLRERLGVRLAETEQGLPESEPFDGEDGLRRHALLSRLFFASLDDAGFEAKRLASRLLAEGLIAPGAVGEQEVATLREALAPALAAWRGWGNDPAQSLPFRLELGSRLLTGTLQHVHAGGLRQFSASKGHGKTLLALGVDALVWSALGETRPVHRLLRELPPEVIAALPAAQAREHLLRLLEVHDLARLEALPFMPDSALAYVRKQPDASAWRAARSTWFARERGDGLDPWVRLALRGMDPFIDKDPDSLATFSHLACMIFDGLPGVMAGGGTSDEGPGDD